MDLDWLVYDDQSQHVLPPHDGFVDYANVDNYFDCLRHENGGQILRMMTEQVM